MRKKLALAIALASCAGTTSENRTAETSSTVRPPDKAAVTLGPFNVDVQTIARHVFIHPTRETGNAAAVITTTNVLSGPDRFERQLPACVELAPGTDSFSVTGNAARFAVFVSYEGESDFSSDACANASLPPAIQR